MPTQRANPHTHPAWLYEPEHEFVPIMEELAARPDPELDRSREGCSDNAKRNWGGARPGAGAPKGNLNALKHGRTSRRQRDLLEALLELPEARQAFIDIPSGAGARRDAASDAAAKADVAHRDHGDSGGDWRRQGRGGWWLRAALALLGVEAVVFVGNGMHCPLTALAVRYGATKGHAFDTFLPERVTRYTFQFFTSVMVAGLVLLALRWAGVVGP